MHRSRLAALIIDCQTTDLAAASAFWSAALGLPVTNKPSDDPGYLHLARAAGDLHVEVQSVSHESRVHIDIESDNVAAEAARLQALGAVPIKSVKDWIVMQAPTGQRFCVVPAESASFEAVAHRWD
jgi:catechol 2,3-dioxygenase-like lactoylglutathione lyase family enzyme